MAMITDKKVVVLVGGVGGAKLALGLQAIVPPENLTVIVNTGDDFWHYGLRICPDIDTVLYTLSGRVNKNFGWGVAEDSTVTLDTLKTLGEDPWFLLGDKDMATHLIRTKRLRDGDTLTAIVQDLATAMGIEAQILPMTDTEVPTMVETASHGTLEFQEYFVKHRWQPRVTALHYTNMEQANMTLAVEEAIAAADIVLMGPSNPWLSIAPILAVPGMREVLLGRAVPRVAVTPIVDGDALKGPAAKLMRELGYPVSPQAVADFYGDVITGFVADERDTAVKSHGLEAVSFDTIMSTDKDKIRLAGDILRWITERKEKTL